MKIYVGTRNVLKVRATRSAFARTFPGESVLVESIAVDANVPSQPFAGEILRGAINRARGVDGPHSSDQERSLLLVKGG